MNKEKNKNNGNEADEETIVVTAPIIIEEGKHLGQIVNVIRNLPNEEENRKYDYLDISIEVTDVDKKPEIKCGFPTNISELSSLGKLLTSSGMEFVEDDAIKINDIKQHLVGRQITFLSKNEKTDAGEFARIIRETIKFS